MIEVKRTFDIKEIKKVAFNELIICDLLEEGESKSDCVFNVTENCYLSIKLNNKLIAIYILNPRSITVLEIHPMIIPIYRKGYCNKSMMHVFRWILDNCSEKIEKIVAQFPSQQKNVERFAIHNGFKKEGVNRLSFKKKGQLLDQTIVGITREEIKEVLS